MSYFSQVSIATIAIIALRALNFAGCSDGIFRVPPGDDGGAHTYQVTIENLTGGQPLSPGVLVTHTTKTRLFEVEETASEGIRYIAERGDPSQAVGELDGNRHAYDVVATESPVGPGGMLKTTIEARADANRLSLAVMLVCTNDGFTGVESIKLPGGFKADTYEVGAYDAGTEANDEMSASIVDGCGLGMDGNTRPATNETIMHHPGIQGGADLVPDPHGWEDPVARVTIRRMK